MKRVSVNNRAKEAKKLLSNGEKLISNKLLNSQDLEIIIALLADQLAELYNVTPEDIANHFDLGVKISLGFDYSYDFVKEKMKLNKLNKQLEMDPSTIIKEAKALDKEEKAQYKQKEMLDRMKTPFWKKLALIGSLLPGKRAKWLEGITNEFKTK